MRKSFELIILIVLNATSSGKCQPPPTFPPIVLPICSVLANAAEYDGKEVTVRGIYRFEIHGSELWGPECESPDKMVSVSRTLGSTDSKKIRKAWRKIGTHERAEVVFRGTFMICRGERAIMCTASIVKFYEFQVRECLFVQPQAAPK